MKNEDLKIGYQEPERSDGQIIHGININHLDKKQVEEVKEWAESERLKQSMRKFFWISLTICLTIILFIIIQINNYSY